MFVKSENDGSGQRNAVPWPPLTRARLSPAGRDVMRSMTERGEGLSPKVTGGENAGICIVLSPSLFASQKSSPLVRGGQGRFAPQADDPHPAVNIRECSNRHGGLWAGRPTKSQGVRCITREKRPVLSGIQNVITDGNPAKWMGGVSKKGRGTGGFVKITRGKSDGLIRF